MAAFRGPTYQWAVSPLTERDRILQRYIDSRPPEDQDAEAQICFGAKSTFGFKAGSGYRTTPTVTVTYPPVEGEDPDPETPDDVYLDFDEVSRTESEVRVENPDDADQYVIVANVDEIVFSGPDLRPDALIGNEGRQQKIYYRYTLHTPTE